MGVDLVGINLMGIDLVCVPLMHNTYIIPYSVKFPLGANFR